MSHYAQYGSKTRFTHSETLLRERNTHVLKLQGQSHTNEDILDEAYVLLKISKGLYNVLKNCFLS